MKKPKKKKLFSALKHIYRNITCINSALRSSKYTTIHIFRVKCNTNNERNMVKKKKKKETDQ